jgi:predicted PurR-regulated permease PerM
MLIVGDEDNRFSIRAYPGWTSKVLRYVQVVLILVAGALLGLRLARKVGRRAVFWAIVTGVLGLIPLGGVRPPTVVMLVLVLAAATWLAVTVAAWMRQRGTSEAGP